MSQFMDWVLDVAAAHPDLDGAFVNAEGEWLDVLLSDGRTFRFRPGQMIDESTPEISRREVLNKLITIGIKQADSGVAEDEGHSTGATGATGATGDRASANGASEAAAGKARGGNAEDSAGLDADSLDESASETSDQRTDSRNDPRTDSRDEARPDSRDDQQKNRTDHGRPSLSSVFDAIMGALGTNSPFPEDFPSGPETKGESLEAEEDPNAEIHRLPIVRPADYFLPSHDHEHDDSMVYIPLTDFLGVGLADDHPDTIQPLFFSDLAERGIAPELGPLFVDAVEELRQLNFSEGQAGIELGIADISGAQVFWLTSPSNYQSSWFADLDMAQTISDSLMQEYPGSLPLFVPASRTSFFVVMADDPKLGKLMEKLRGHENDDDALYPLPHTVASDGWKEWIPMSDHPAAQILEELRITYRKRIYDRQAKEIEKWEGAHPSLKSYNVHHLRSGGHVSNCQFTNRDRAASLPQTDFISFVRQPSGLPWDEDPGETVTIRFHIARDIWPEGFDKADGVWPPRWDVHGFPSQEELNELSEAAHRDF